MAMSHATVRSWIEGFEPTREVGRAATRPGNVSRAATIALQLSDAALLTRAPEMRARRDAEDLDDVESLLLVHGRAMDLRRVRAVVADFAAALEDEGRPAVLERLVREAGLR
jgi:hypothetical protein